MRITPKNVLYAARHPIRTVRYLRHRDVIPYGQIAGFLPERPVILEAGAANGLNTLEMAMFWPGARIHAFEPVPSAREALISRTSDVRDRVNVYPYALGDKAGTFQMNISGEGSPNDSQSSSLLNPTGHSNEYGFVSFQKQIPVEVVTMDDWAESRGVFGVDFLWLDMQGFELNALRGGTRMLASVSAVHMEVANIPLYEGAPLSAEVRNRMRSMGFRVAREAVFRIGGNVLFVRTAEGA